MARSRRYFGASGRPSDPFAEHRLCPKVLPAPSQNPCWWACPRSRLSPRPGRVSRGPCMVRPPLRVFVIDREVYEALGSHFAQLAVKATAVGSPQTANGARADTTPRPDGW